MANTRLKRTVSNSSSSGRRTFTWSGWIKRNNVTAGYQNLFSAYGGANYYTRILYWDTQELTVSSKQGSNFPVDLRSTTKHRDTNAWYHIVVAMDSTQSTVTDRIKIYFNGVRQTGFHGGDSSYPSLNEQCQINHNDPHYIGHLGGGSSGYFDGIISHVHFADGTAYPASTFGSTDSTTGEWTINTSPSFTPGTNGFSILKDGNGVTDVSANSNNWSVETGTLTATKDCPDNVFATGNPLNVNSGGVGTFQYGNNDITVNGASGSQFGSSSTLGMTNGKFYCEAKIITVDSTMIGVSPSPAEDARADRSPDGQASSGAVGCLVGSGNKYVSGNGSSYGAATSANGIMMIALDLDNLKVYFGSGGQWSNGSGAWNQSGLTSGAAISVTAVASTAEGAYFFSFGDGGGSSAGRIQWNFGNGYFGTTAITTNSGNGYAGAEGKSKFNYAVPSGYSALSTKGLNT